MSKQAPTQLRLLVPEADRVKFDEAYRTEVVQYVLSVIDDYIANKIDDIDKVTQDQEQYSKASWSYLQADAIGSKRALRHLALTLKL